MVLTRHPHCEEGGEMSKFHPLKESWNSGAKLVKNIETTKLFR